MNKFRMKRAGIDVNQGLDRLFGDVDLYEELLLKYLEDSHYEDLCKALEAGDVKEAFSAAHSLKGVAGNLSMTDLYEAVVPVVEKLRSGDIDVADGMPAIKEANDKVRTAIEDMKG